MRANPIVVTEGFRLWFLHKLNFDGFTTFWGDIWLRPCLSYSRMKQVIKHEQTHIEQINRDGIIKFSYHYLSQLFSNYLKTRDWHQAYLYVDYEIQARLRAGESV